MSNRNQARSGAAVRHGILGAVEIRPKNPAVDMPTAFAFAPAWRATALVVAQRAPVFLALVFLAPAWLATAWLADSLEMGSRGGGVGYGGGVRYDGGVE